MRRNLIVAAGVLAFGVSSATLVRAEGRAVSKDSAVTFRLASTTPTAGFQEMKTQDGTTVYVSPRVTFTSDEVVTAMNGQTRGDLDITLTAEAAERIDRTEGDLIAVSVGGKLTATARLGNVDREGVSISGLADGELTRLSSLLGVGNAQGPVIRAVPRQTMAKPGSVVTVDLFVMGAPSVRTFQVGLDAVGGRTGTLTRQPGHIDDARGDFVFGSAQAINAVDDSRGRFGGTLFDGAVNATNSSYLGTFDYLVSDDASGTFIVKIKFDDDSFLLDENSEYVPFLPMNASIKVGGTGARNTR